MNSTDFWNSRAKKNRHTGWSSRAIYAFDQQVRLMAIHRVLGKIGVSKGTALDFGSGTGDFSRMLAHEFNNVLAFDISEHVQQINQQKSIAYTNIVFHTGASVLDLNIADGSLDLVLSITVLGHIMAEDDLQAHLQYFKSKLNERGVLIALEYIAHEKHESEYQRLLTKKEWEASFLNAGFSSVFEMGIYNPLTTTIGRYKKYISMKSVYALSIFSRFGWAQKWLEEIAGQMIGDVQIFYWDGKAEDDMKIMVFRK